MANLSFNDVPLNSLTVRDIKMITTCNYNRVSSNNNNDDTVSFKFNFDAQAIDNAGLSTANRIIHAKILIKIYKNDSVLHEISQSFIVKPDGENVKPNNPYNCSHTINIDSYTYPGLTFTVSIEFSDDDGGIAAYKGGDTQSQGIIPSYLINKVIINYNNLNGSNSSIIYIDNNQPTTPKIENTTVYGKTAQILNYYNNKNQSRDSKVWYIDYNNTRYYIYEAEDYYCTKFNNFTKMGLDFSNNRYEFNAYPLMRDTKLTINYYVESPTKIEDVNGNDVTNQFNLTGDVPVHTQTFNSNQTLGNVPPLLGFNSDGQYKIYKEYYNCNLRMWKVQNRNQVIEWDSVYSSVYEMSHLLEYYAVGEFKNTLWFDDYEVNLYLWWEENLLTLNYKYDDNGPIARASTFKCTLSNISLWTTPQFNKDYYQIKKEGKPIIWIGNNKEFNSNNTYNPFELSVDDSLRYNDETITLVSKWYPNILTVKFIQPANSSTTHDLTWVDLTYEYNQELTDDSPFKCPYLITDFYADDGYKIMGNKGWYHADSGKYFHLEFNWTETNLPFKKFDIEEQIKTGDVTVLLELHVPPITYYINYITDSNTKSLSLIKDGITYEDKGTKRIVVPYLYTEDVDFSLVKAVKPGYKIEGFYKDQNHTQSNKLDNNFERPVNDGKHIYAFLKWNGVNYSIAYYNDDKSLVIKDDFVFGSSDKVRGINDIEGIVKNNPDLDKSYILSGWSFNADENNRNIQVELDETLVDGIGISPKIPEEGYTFTLYPTWQVDNYPTYVIVDSGSDYVQTILMDDNANDIKLNAPVLYRPGYQFNGWYVKKQKSDEWLSINGNWINNNDNIDTLSVWQPGHVIEGPYPYEFNIILQPIWIMKGHIFVKIQEDDNDKWVPAIIYIKKEDGSWTMVEATYVKKEDNWLPTII